MSQLGNLASNELPSKAAYDSTTATWSFWFKSTVSFSGAEHGSWLSGRMDADSSYNGIGFLVEPDGKLSFAVKNSSTDTEITSTGSYDDGKWHNVVGLVKGNSTMTLYVDGASVGSATPPSGWTFNSQVSRIAKALDTWWSKHPFMIDDVRIYNRALSATEMQQLYNLGTANAAHSNAVAFSNGLVGYWPLDGAVTNWRTNTTADLSGKGNTGSLVSLGTSTAPVAGKIGQALKFNGSDSTVTVGTTGWSNTSGTFSFWAYPTAAKTGTTNFVFCHHPVGDNGCGGSDRIYARLVDGALTIGLGGNANIATGVTFNLNQWTHFTVTYNNGSYTVFKNGILSNAGSYTNTLTIQSSASIGRSNGGTEAAFAGLIDDLRVFDRALSAGEAKQLYNSGAANIAHSNVWISDGLVGYWTFDGSATNWRTNTTADLSGNGNTGKLSTLSTTTTPVAGKIGQAFTFNGSQAVRIEDSPSLDVGDIVSYSMWIKRARKGALEVFFAKDFNTAVGAFESNNTVSLYRSAGGLVLGTTATLTDTNFHYLVFTKNGATVRIYIDGALAASTNSSSQTLSNNDRPLCLGLDSSSGVCGNNPFKGVIDDFRVYNRELSAVEVSRLHNAGK